MALNNLSKNNKEGNMKKTKITLCLIFLVLFLGSCSSIEQLNLKLTKYIEESYEKDMQKFGDNNLTSWYKKIFYPELLESIKKESTKYKTRINISKEISPIYVGAELYYVDVHTESDLSKIKFIHKTATDLYKKYINNHKGKIITYKPMMARKFLFSSEAKKVVDKFKLKKCFFERMYIGKIDSRVSSALIDVTCFYPDPIQGLRYWDFVKGWIIIIRGDVVENTLDQLPNSLLQDTLIQY